MIMQSTILVFMLSTSSGVRTLVIDSPAITMQSFRFSILGIISPARLASTLSSKIGPTTTTGFVLLSVWHAKSSVIWSSAMRPALSSFPFGDQRIFGPSFFFDGVHWSSFVHDWVVLPDLPHLFIRGKAKNSIFGSGPLNFSMVALRINFSIAPRQGPALVCNAFRVPQC